MIVTVIEIKRPYLKDTINNIKKSDTWKIQLKTSKNFFSSIDNDEEHVIHSKNNNIDIMINDEADKVIKKNFFIYLKKDIKIIWSNLHCNINVTK